MPIPDFRADGLLPEGVHEATWEEIRACYGWNPTRVEILRKLELAVQHFKQAGCRTMHINGSFVTNKDEPGDFDACWDNTGVKAELIDPVLLDQSRKGRDAIWNKYGGDIKPDMASPEGSIQTYVKFFQKSRDGVLKGIIRLNLKDYP